MDKFTANMLLEVAKIDNDTGADLYKEFNVVEGGPTQEAYDFFIANKGKLVQINGTNMYGYVKELNTSTRGFYPGYRYPIYVKICKDERTEFSALGKTFEYSLDQLKPTGHNNLENLLTGQMLNSSFILDTSKLEEDFKGDIVNSVITNNTETKGVVVVNIDASELPVNDSKLATIVY